MQHECQINFSTSFPKLGSSKYVLCGGTVLILSNIFPMLGF